MEVTKGQGDLCRVEFCLGLRKPLDLREICEQLATLDVIHDEVDAQGFLEHIIHSYHEGVIHLLEDFAL